MNLMIMPEISGKTNAIAKVEDETHFTKLPAKECQKKGCCSALWLKSHLW